MIPTKNHILPKCLICQPAFRNCNPIFISLILSNPATLRAHRVICLNPTKFRAPDDSIHLTHLSHILHLTVYIVIKWSTSLRVPVFTDVTLSHRVSISRRFEVTYCLHPEGSISVHLTNDGNTFRHNVRKNPDNATWHP
jgi:hypothetical protein